MLDIEIKEEDRVGDTDHRNWFGVLSVALIVLALDQLTKQIVDRTLQLGEIRSLPLGIEIVNSRNSGVAFGLFDQGGSVLILIAVVAVAVTLTLFHFSDIAAQLWFPIGLAMGGAIGNLIDRLLHGSVIDFISISAWPTFNVADVAIAAAVLITFLLFWLADQFR